MGLYSMPSPAEAGLPFALLANALLPIVLLMGGVRWAILKVMGFDGGEDGQEETLETSMVSSAGVGARVTRFKYLRQKDGGVGDCSVCLHGFEEEEEVSEVLACRHFFHRACLDRWLGLFHSTCPLCRSML
ncbi:probable E3 ubiquitin-protein ligase XERICO [Elaeis guineensis]|uniref:Probable E3 ubiquitin-protein ligase XERICO n=1 Tax=Elaeis guineensis var. tenera TaxID=51953 RepID=A0A6I9QRJ3_ELAGV|nr:probable E3 ubiquitin-protein ligase XERICO [Elaeis guineensis]